MNSSFPSNRALGKTQGGGTQGSATECSALKPRAVGCESRAGRPPHTKDSKGNYDGEDHNVEVGEDCEDFDEEDGDPDPIPQRVGAKWSKSSLE
jgi:hypothetical protein